MQSLTLPKARNSVLVVDDDRDVRESLCDLFLDEGYAVRAAVDGEDALKNLSYGPLPGVVVLDLMMPKMDGYEFLARRSADVLLREVPVIVVSGTTHNHPVPFPGDFSLIAVLPKPLVISDLLELIRREQARH